MKDGWTEEWWPSSVKRYVVCDYCRGLFAEESPAHRRSCPEDEVWEYIEKLEAWMERQVTQIMVQREKIKRLEERPTGFEVYG